MWIHGHFSYILFGLTENNSPPFRPTVDLKDISNNCWPLRPMALDGQMLWGKKKPNICFIKISNKDFFVHFFYLFKNWPSWETTRQWFSSTPFKNNLQMIIKRWKDKQIVVYTMEYYSVTKRNQLRKGKRDRGEPTLIHATIWMNRKTYTGWMKSYWKRVHVVWFHLYEVRKQA